LPFSLLSLAWLALLLGVRFGLEEWVRVAAQSTVAPLDPSEVMAMPPKPLGQGDLPEPGTPGEGEGENTVLNLAICEKIAKELQDTCFQALARQTAPADPDEALRTCTHVREPEMALECQADVAEAIAHLARERATTICSGIDSTKWRGQCHFGVGLATAEIDPEYAIGRCADAEIFQTFCRHDVVGEVALVDTPAANRICAREEGDWLTRKTCWHGIGKYLSRRDMNEASTACEAGTVEWKGTCYHGIGWGGAERDVEAALQSCTRFGAYADNCKHGVANQQKRADPARAVALCESVTKPDTRARCLDFVTR
jgi:hypothetical protein